MFYQQASGFINCGMGVGSQYAFAVLVAQLQYSVLFAAVAMPFIIRSLLHSYGPTVTFLVLVSRVSRP